MTAWRSRDLNEPFEYLGEAITPRSNEVDDWDNYRIQGVNSIDMKNLGLVSGQFSGQFCPGVEADRHMPFWQFSIPHLKPIFGPKFMSIELTPRMRTLPSYLN